MFLGAEDCEILLPALELYRKSLPYGLDRDKVTGIINDCRKKFRRDFGKGAKA